MIDVAGDLLCVLNRIDEDCEMAACRRNFFAGVFFFCWQAYSTVITTEEIGAPRLPRESGTRFLAINLACAPYYLLTHGRPYQVP